MQTATVILTSFNRPVLLQRAVISVLKQDYKGPIELIIVDDNSEYDAAEMLEKLLENIELENRSVRLIDSHKADKWRRFVADYARNINTGILASTGDVIFYLTDDDEFVDNHVSILMQFLEDNPHADFVFGNQLVEYLHEETLETAFAGYRINENATLDSAANIIDHNQFAQRATTFETVGLWVDHKDAYGAADGVYFDRIKAAGYIFYNATPIEADGKTYVTSKHRLHATSVQGLMLDGKTPEWGLNNGGTT